MRIFGKVAIILVALATRASAQAAEISSGSGVVIGPNTTQPTGQELTTYKDIAGQWCGEITDYVFAPDWLTVKFHDDRPARGFKITKYTYTKDSVSINWLNGDGKESLTVFSEFLVNGTTMAQQQNGDKPRRFHRC
jgi:hypothetical protein